GSNGADNLNLRNLGTQRTLVLMDGRRVVSDNSSGAVDIAQLPEALIQRVDIVTGGASAAYGSDAVAGVVNFILNDKFEGFKADAQAGISQYDDNMNYKTSLTYGGEYMGGRLHVVASFLDNLSDGVTTARSRPWTARATAQITNPAVTSANPASPTNPINLVVVGGVSSIAGAGGLVTGSNLNTGCTGPAPGTQANPSFANPSLAGCSASTLLRGTTFNLGGTARNFNYGTLVSGTTMEGGEGVADNPNLDLTLQPRQRRDQFFTHVTYDLDDNNSIFFQVNSSLDEIHYRSLPTFEVSTTAFTVYADNAYLPASVAQAMQANNVRGIVIGRDSADIAIPTMSQWSHTGQVTIGADGKLPLGSTWDYHWYGQMGRNYVSYLTNDDPISDNLYAASDAVVNPANGQIVCRSVLNGSVSAASSGCVPIDIFGSGSPSAAAKDYVTGTAMQLVHVAEDVTEGSVNGDLFDLPAGTVSAAGGMSYRREAFNQVTDPRSQEIRTGAGLPGFPTGGIPGFPTGIANSLGGYERTNPQPTHGTYNVWEAFLETEVPLLKDQPFAKSLTFNAAGRYIDYSLSGGVEPWKLGLVWEPIDDFRLRASRSTDIRAPTLGELYQGSSQGTSTVQDSPNHSTALVTVLTGAVGNTNLVPESANTTTIGGVLSPDFLPGFQLSVDYYSITISKAIQALTAQQTLDQCADGVTYLCTDDIIRTAGGGLSRVLLPFFNVAGRLTKGEDIELDYHADVPDMGWGDGNYTGRIIANHIDEFTTQVLSGNPAPPAVKLADDIGVNSTPSWTWNFQNIYQTGPWGLFVQERFIGSGKIDRSKSPSQISLNEVEQVIYTDMTLSYDINDALQGYLSITNLFDRDPPPVPSTLISGPNFGNRTLYDIIGRQFTLGVHYKL
ncbi:MAG TPA: TonB-dependent receptor, partial [Rhizomicrobium sp.]|nr:TonB-dependent receptor [Rhizomicrobium sp.]